MYDGTISSQDPNLVESFDLDEQTHAYIIRDVEAEAPDWDGIGVMFRLSYDHERYDFVDVEGDGDESPRIAGAIVSGARQAWDRFRDHELVARYLRMFHDAADVDYSDSIFRDSVAYGVVTHAEVTAWGCEDAEGLAEQGLNVIRQWAEGSVYGVIVTNTETGEEESVWDIYDDTPDLSYCRSAAVEIAPIGVQA